MTRASLLETIVEDHVRMARALGFSERDDLRPPRAAAGARTR